MTACSWSGASRSAIPSGSKRTGRKTPNTPGSMEVREHIVRIGISVRTGDPARTTALMRRQRIHHQQPMPANPHAQMPNRIADSGLEASGGGVDKGDGTGGAVNGWLTSSIKTDQLDCVVSGADCHRM